MVTVSYGKWNGTTFAAKAASKYGNCNAVKVTIAYNVPLVFAQVLGLANKTASKTSIAEEVVSVDTPYVAATGNPWLAGEPTGTQGSQPDPNFTTVHGSSDHQYKYDLAGPYGKNTNGATATASTYNTYETYASPVQIAFTVTPGSRVTITNTSGSTSYDYQTPAFSDATGNTGGTGNTKNAAANGVSEHGIADAYMPLGSMNAVFLSNSLPDSIATVPPPLDFSSQAARNYIALEPKLQQVFYTGTGTTSTGKQQSIMVPANATRLFLGTMDGWEWDNNIGGYNTTVTQTTITTVE